MVGAGNILGVPPIRRGVQNFTKMGIKPTKLEKPSQKLASKQYLTKSLTPLRMIGDRIYTKGTPHIKGGSKFYKNGHKTCKN